MKLKVLSVESTPIDLLVIDERKRLYKTASSGMMLIKTKTGVVRIRWEEGVETDGRSGGWLVDKLIPNVGDEFYRRCWFAHDCMYSFASCCERKGESAFPSFELANNLFYQIGSLSRKKGGGGVSKWRMLAAERGVSTKFGRKAYDTTDKTDRHNDGKIKITWDAK